MFFLNLSFLLNVRYIYKYIKEIYRPIDWSKIILIGFKEIFQVTIIWIKKFLSYRKWLVFSSFEVKGQVNKGRVIHKNYKVLPFIKFITHESYKVHTFLVFYTINRISSNITLPLISHVNHLEIGYGLLFSYI